MIPLFETYPKLEAGLPFVSLGIYPTPVVDASVLDPDARSGGIFIKQDGLTGEPYGGNKVRKLEFLLAQAQREGHSHVLTFGGAGSNHALATAIYAQKLGLHPISMLIAQPNAHAVRRNLLRSLATGVELHHYKSMPAISLGTFMRANKHILKAGRWPFLIPPGGTSPMGLLGFVNAAFELKAQVDAGELPMPDFIYAASGTMGTCVGLALGLQLLGLDTKVVAVRVTDARFTSLKKAEKLFQQAYTILKKADPALPECRFNPDNFLIRHDFFGEEYARYTEIGMAAVRKVKENIHIKIEGTYTGKCVAALLHDLDTGALDGKVALFWNTYNAHDLVAVVEGVDYQDLPKAFHRYFEEPVQPLDV
jgi:D-cysteine desulfhydrase